MLDNAADVEDRHFGESGVAIAGEEVLLTFPNRLMDVHSRAIVADDRFRHEGGGLAIFGGGVVHGVFQAHQPVGALDERGELGADFVLAGGCDFVVMHFHENAHLLQRHRDCRSDVLQRIDWRNREVTALD